MVLAVAETDSLRVYVELIKDMDREARALLVDVLREEEAISRAEAVNTDALADKYGMRN